ncbi:class I SAM-dependent methyltransferase [Clostridium pasteurianum]|uniref:class I SAM-dependent methyltransferase n=1 Tax=Clostridium pasteurianum TaxID=1501 RepID=UPI00226104A7|nr:class I SAM-dependent methyltransferase [Clostridium pasteurianum]UZW15108.1 class I SAM-dependent methyltransferase [Clostridium pasteurianum]
MNNDEKQDYDKMNWLYNAFYGDMATEQLRQLEFIENHKDLLQSYTDKEVYILDSACGNGVKAIALALNGYNITATDISMEMVKFTNEFSKKHNVSISTDVKSWSELPSVFQPQFDIVFNIGNSIVHSPNAVTRENDISSLVQVLKKKGTLVIETRNWEKILAENKRFTVYDKISYLDKEYIPMYHWKFNGIEQESEVEILFQEIWRDNHVELYENSLSFTPFTHMSLLDIMKKLGLDIIKDTFHKECDWYLIYGRKA